MINNNNSLIFYADEPLADLDFEINPGDVKLHPELFLRAKHERVPTPCHEILLGLAIKRFARIHIDWQDNKIPTIENIDRDFTHVIEQILLNGFAEDFELTQNTNEITQAWQAFLQDFEVRSFIVPSMQVIFEDLERENLLCVDDALHRTGININQPLILPTKSLISKISEVKLSEFGFLV